MPRHELEVIKDRSQILAVRVLVIELFDNQPVSLVINPKQV